MEKFKKFIGKPFKLEVLKNENVLQNSSICCQNLPDKIEEFEEIEFLVDDIVMCVAVLEGKIKRIMLVKVNKEAPDECTPLTKEELEAFLKKNEEKLLKFFENITN
ncbi:MAG: hypothetical protein ACPLZA_05085 [Thermodesulfovibrio sp.]|jgi:hypothetical protein|uniref:Uncharacterized protein n=1 Tax=Thermodesulfovibrio obliviosus TaxID=3118332 RepID=A0AAU8H1K0_9BACT